MRVINAMALAMCTTVCACLFPAYSAERLTDEAFEERYSAPAVSGLNGKISLGYLGVNFDPYNSNTTTNPFPDAVQDGHFVEGSVSVPVGERFGFQLDGAYGDFGSELDLAYKGVGGHLFWRDPARALVGIYAHYMEYGNAIETTQVAVEAEIYMEQVSLEFLAGVDFVTTGSVSNEYFAGEAVAAYYPTDNVRLYAGVSHSVDTTSLVMGAEALVPSGKVAPSLFADITYDEDNNTSISAGLRFYLGGENKSLIRRHREDDPKVRLQPHPDAIGDCGDSCNTADNQNNAGNQNDAGNQNFGPGGLPDVIPF